MGVGKHSYACVRVSTVTEHTFFFMLKILNKLYIDSLLALVFIYWRGFSLLWLGKGTLWQLWRARFALHFKPVLLFCQSGECCGMESARRQLQTSTLYTGRRGFLSSLCSFASANLEVIFILQNRWHSYSLPWLPVILQRQVSVYVLCGVFVICPPIYW